jgi:hypothetical protein
MTRVWYVCIGLTWLGAPGCHDWLDTKCSAADDCAIVSSCGSDDCHDEKGEGPDECASPCKVAAFTEGIVMARRGMGCAELEPCAGDQSEGELDAPDLCARSACAARRAIVTGGLHTCLLLESGAVRCWGHNQAGQLGYGHTQDIGDDERPDAAGYVDAGGTVVQLTAGLQHTCALLRGGAVRCWGLNNAGQLGYGHTDTIGDDELPSTVGTVQVGGTVVQLAAGLRHTCALLDSGAVRCWGRNNVGQLGYGHTDTIGDDELPSTAGDVDVGGVAVQIAAGGHHTCALLDSGAIRCWGRNYEGQLGYGHTRPIGDDELPSTAGDVLLGSNAVQVGTGWNHTCALTDTGAARCWGFNHYGQLGYGHDRSIGDDEAPSLAGDVPIGSAITHLMVGNDYTCARLDSAAVRCWGNNDYGQLGYGHTRHIGDDEPVTAASEVDVGGPVAQLAVGLGLHMCVLMNTGAARCWGFNGYGQMGYGHTDPVGDNELPYTAGDVSCP